ncbi:MAG: universal stress protein [Chlorobiaceae bacterium]|nr:universal stress protein [Chlorobiaceae bacterium]NTW11085.1 universal stress protein [Chlorobiaceae bacterium]
MALYRNILVAIDCSPVDETVIGHISALAVELGSAVHLLHIVHSHTLDQERDLRAQAAEIMERHKTFLTEKGIGVNVIIRSGEPDREIVREIAENSYDLLAMATHGHALPGRILFGSISRSLQEKTTIPLLLIRAIR